MTDFKGKIVWNPNKPDGTLRKLLDVNLIHSLGWKHSIELVDGIGVVYKEKFCK